MLAMESIKKEKKKWNVVVVMSFSPNPGATWKESVPSLAFISNWNVVVMERVADAMISFRLANL